MRNRPWLVLALLFVTLATPRAQDAVTSKQRIADIEALAALYAKNYAPYEWKRDVIGFDLLRLTPWLQRIQHADDLDFQEALIEYVSSLNDAHDLIIFPSTFSATLGFTVDIYDGKVLIDTINRLQLPIAQFPFNIGDELVTVDGTPVASLIASFRKYAIAANQRSTDRTAASRIVSRSQQVMPHALDVAGDAVLQIRNGNTGTVGLYTVPWRTSGIPMDSQGPVVSPRRGNGRIFLPSDGLGFTSPAGTGDPAPQIFKLAESTPSDNTLPEYMAPIAPLLNASVARDYYTVIGIGSRTPVWGPPPGFVVRLGTQATHFFLSGTYISNGVRIGFIRIPSMSPGVGTATALQQLDDEIRFFNTNVDALVVDVMRNPGGLVSFTEAVAQRFIPNSVRITGFQIRATAAMLFQFSAMLSAARNNPATPPDVLANLENNYNEVRRAFEENRGLSNPVSLNSTGSLTLPSVPHAFQKPLILLVDEFSASGGDAFAAIMQDNNRGPLVGMRTMGAGGTVVSFSGPAYTESITRMTTSLMHRGRTIYTQDFPPAPYIENIGVRPEITIDYMTRQNLMTAGSAFVAAFTQAIVQHAQSTP
jgi:hypothetical protein